ncbi:MAG: FKBP-type peptidyl-prolyl cis-trans isomerase [Saprospiraceae bacterium]|nr:FKBP-type peptidyl-prolyl cis-trans isomerase [Saprospiraceae bacterium]
MRILFMLLALSMLGLTACESGEGGSSGEVQVLEDGTQYIYHKKTGNPAAKPGDFVRFHVYTGTDTEVLNSSRETGNEPAYQIPPEGTPSNPNSPVPGFLETMGVGDSLTILVNLDTLPQKPPGFEDKSMLYYSIAIQKIQSNAEYEIAQQEEREAQEKAAAVVKERLPEVEALVQSTVANYASNSIEGLETLDSGLKILRVEEGDGEKPAVRETVKVLYYGTLTDGTRFDDAFSRGSSFDFPLGAGRVIKGWDEGIAELTKGSKAFLFVPSEMGYGGTGSPPVIPPDAELIFYVELLK